MTVLFTSGLVLDDARAGARWVKKLKGLELATALPMLLSLVRTTPLQFAPHSEASISQQILMQLDDVIVTTSQRRSAIRWLDRCISAHKTFETQNLFCIIQGGLDLDLRGGVL